MKIILTLIILSAATCYAQSITVDPNSIVEADGLVTVNMQLTITDEQYEAMQHKNLTFADVVRRMSIASYYERLMDRVKLLLTRQATIQQLKDLER